MSRATAPLWFEYPAAQGHDAADRIATVRELLRDPSAAEAAAAG